MNNQDLIKELLKIASELNAYAELDKHPLSFERLLREGQIKKTDPQFKPALDKYLKSLQNKEELAAAITRLVKDGVVAQGDIDEATYIRSGLAAEDSALSALKRKHFPSLANRQANMDENEANRRLSQEATASIFSYIGKRRDVWETYMEAAREVGLSKANHAKIYDKFLEESGLKGKNLRSLSGHLTFTWDNDGPVRLVDTLDLFHRLTEGHVD
jgi:hypothetical protein